VIFSSHLSKRYPRCECHGDWFYPDKKFDRPLKAVVVATEFSKIEQVIEPKLMAFLPKDWIASAKRTPQGYLRRIVGKEGSTIDILTNEMEPMAFESSDWDLAWIDEPTSKGRYHAILRGLVDRQGQMVLTFTPLVEPWMKEDLVDMADGVNIDVVQADTYENVEDIHNTPILTRASIEQFERALPEDERSTRIHGKFFHLRGLVYVEFMTSMHLRDFEYEYPDPVIAVLDPHDRLPHHVIWAFLDRNDWLHVDRELITHPACTLLDLKKAILLTEQKANYKMVKRLTDPNFSKKPVLTTGRTVVQELCLAPFPVRFGLANDDRMAGHLKVKDYLHWNKDLPVGFTNSPKLFFHRTRVPKTVHSIQNYQYDEWRGKTGEQKDPKEKEKQKDTHGADCIRYLCMSNPRFDSQLGMLEESYSLEEAAY
jgi:hypothetical protein